MIKKYINYFIIKIVFLSIEVLICLSTILYSPLFTKFTALSTSATINQKNIIYPFEKRGFPTYDTTSGDDGWSHYRLFFWVPKTTTRFAPYVDDGIETAVSSHGPVEKWSVVETPIATFYEKLVFIYVPKTFVYLYGNDFDMVIHLNYS